MTAVIRARIRRPLLAAAVVLLPAVLASGCSSASGTTSSSSPAASAPTSAATTPASTPSVSSPTAAPVGALTGKWSGKYSGAYTGTFELTWIESSGTLKGTINLSTAGTLPLNGTVNGSAITFGTVGSTVITYTGTVSGDTMSGTYAVAGSQNGSWSAHRTS